jgi:hypothetical protein
MELIYFPACKIYRKRPIPLTKTFRLVYAEFSIRACDEENAQNSGGVLAEGAAVQLKVIRIANKLTASRRFGQRLAI